MKKSLVICLSLLVLASCKSTDFSDRPAGWSCTYWYDETNLPASGFYCNGMRYPESRQFFHYTDPRILKARAMPADTAARYDEYIKNKIEQHCK